MCEDPYGWVSLFQVLLFFAGLAVIAVGTLWGISKITG